jgi:hypothetical protein
MARRPNLFLIGAMKSGTTYLCKLLDEERFWRVVSFAFGRLGYPIPKIIHRYSVVTTLAWRAHTPSRYSGKVVLFAASDRGPEYGIDHTLGWRVSALGALEIHSVPGDHRSIMRPPHIQVIAQRLTPYLAPDEAA